MEYHKCICERYTIVTPHTKSVGGEPRWLPVNNIKPSTTMAKNIFSDDNYQDFDLAMNWSGKGIALSDISLHLFPKTDKNPNDLIGVSVKGKATRNIYGPVDPETGEAMLLVEQGKYIYSTLFPRCLPDDIAKWGTITEKDGKKVFTPKVKIVNCDYRIGALIDDDGELVLDTNGNKIWGNPKVLGVYIEGKKDIVPLGTEPVPFNG